MEKHTIKRDGLPPLSFTGEIIGEGDNRTASGERQNRWTEVTVYRTKGGKYVTKIRRISQWQGESCTTEAFPFADAADAISFLKNAEGRLGASSQEAVEKAAQVDENFAAAWKDEVE